MADWFEPVKKDTNKTQGNEKWFTPSKYYDPAKVLKGVTPLYNIKQQEQEAREKEPTLLDKVYLSSAKQKQSIGADLNVPEIGVTMKYNVEPVKNPKNISQAINYKAELDKKETEKFEKAIQKTDDFSISGKALTDLSGITDKKTYQNIIDREGIYQYMTDDERRIYKYLIAKKDNASARKYLLEKMSDLESRKAYAVAGSNEGGFVGTVKDFSTAAKSGLESGLTNMARMGVAGNIAAGNSMGVLNKLLEPTYSEKLYAQVRANAKDKGYVYGVLLDAINSISAQLPQIAMGAAGGSGAYLSAMALQIIGADTTEAINQGYDGMRGVVYGIFDTALEFATEKVLGGIASKLDGGETSRLVRAALNAVDSTVSNKKVANALAKTISVLYSANSEGVEEFLQAVIEPVMRNVIYGERNNLNAEIFNEAVRAYIVGAVSGGIMDIPFSNNTLENTRADITGKFLKENTGVESVLKLSEVVGNNSELYGEIKSSFDGGRDVSNTDLAMLYQQSAIMFEQPSEETYKNFAERNVDALIKEAVNKQSNENSPDSESAKYMAESATQTDTVNSVNETDNSVNGKFGTKSVFTEYSAKKYKADPIESYMFKEHGREKLSDDQLQIVMVARKLGHGVVFEDTAKTRGFKSDGYIENDGTIHIDYDNIKPVQFVFKHELTHYAEGSELYKNFVETVKASKTYSKWISQKVGGNDSAAVKSAKYRQSVIDGYAASGIELTPMQAESELIADFVGDTLFTEDGTGLEGIMSDMNAKQRKSFVQYIRDFFAYIKDKLSRNKTATRDILKLEKKFNETLSAVEQKNFSDTETEKYSIADRKITMNMTDDERAELLNNTVIKLAEYDGKSDDLNGKNVLLLKSSYNSQAGKILKSLGEKFGVFKTYNNQNVSLDFDYSRGSLNESVHKQGDISTDFYDFAKMLYVFDEVVKNAVPIEVHTDKYKGTSRENTNLKSDYVLLSAFRDDNYIVPVEFHLKEMHTGSGQENKLYVSVTLGKIKMEDKVKVAVSDENYQTKDTNLSSAISIPDLISKVNPEYGDFYKYLPESMLNEQQNNSRKTAVNDENYRLKVMRGEDVTEMLAEKAKEKGYSKDDSWKMDHKAPNSKDGYSNSMDNIDKSYGSDGSIYSQQAVYYYGEGREYDNKAISIIKSAKNNPEKMIKIYRAVPNSIKDTRVRNGDWVAIVKEYAIEHGGRVLDDDFRIIENTVPAKHLFSNGDSINEWGYDNGNANEVYKNSENNVKILDVTYDDNGKIIPLSERFNDKNADIKHSIPFNQAELLDKYDRGEISREEYLNQSNENWKEAVNSYGTIEAGENPVNDIPVPKSVDGKQKTQRFSRTLIESGKLTNRMVEDMGADILLGKFAYTPVSDESAQAAADKAVNGGFAEISWQEAVSASKLITKDKIAIGEKLLMQAIANKDTKRVLELSAELSDVLTRNGQNIQAASMFKKMTGAGKLLTVQQYVNTLNKDLEAKYGENAPTVKINELIAQQIAESKPGEDIYSIYEDALQDVAAQVPATFLDKWNAWRYFAMLCNLRTHMQNFVGNMVFGTAVYIKDAVGTVVEHAVMRDVNQRTKAIVIKKEYREFASNKAKLKEIQDKLSGNGQFDDKGKIYQMRRIFKTEWLEQVTKGNGDLLESCDMLFKNIHFKHALAGFLQARNADLNNISKKTLDEAVSYSIREAKKATFQDASWLANWLNSIRIPKKDKSTRTKRWAVAGTKIVIEGVLPFKKTPINIVKRGVEYSPIGLLNTLTLGLHDVKTGDITVSEFCDGLAAGITGTGIMLVGMFLRSIGAVQGGFGDDDEDKFKKLNGEQEYSLNIGGKSYTIDWAAPACIPFFVGTELAEEIEENDGFQFKDLTESFWNVLEPITNLSMLQGIQNLIQTVKYEDSSRTFGTVMGDISTSYITQGIPALFGATARTVDKTQRQWYTDKNSPLDDFTQSTAQNVISKIPVATLSQAPVIDAWGREKIRGGIGERVLENFVSPGYYSDIEYSEMSKELLRLSKEVKSEDVNVLPKTAQKSFEVNGKTKYLTAEEYTKYAKAKGRYSYDYVSEFVNSSEYKKLTDEERAKVISNLYKYANAKAKTEVSDYDITKSFKTVSQWDKRGKSPVIYYIGRVLAEK